MCVSRTHVDGGKSTIWQHFLKVRDCVLHGPTARRRRLLYSLRDAEAQVQTLHEEVTHLKYVRKAFVQLVERFSMLVSLERPRDPHAIFEGTHELLALDNNRVRPHKRFLV